MPAIKRNLKIEQGSTFTFAMTRKTPSGVPIDMTGFYAEFILKTSVGGGLIITATTENGRIVIEGSKLTVTLTDEETSELSFVTGYYNLNIENTNGEVYRFFEGKVEFGRAV